MTSLAPRGLRAALCLASALGGAALAGQASAQAGPAASGSPGGDGAAQGGGDVIVTAARTTRSAIAISAVEIQKILPGVSPLKAIETLPGVLFETADPWGNNEQNEELFAPRMGFVTLSASF